MTKKRILTTIRNNRANLYLLHEAVEGLVFGLEALADILNGEVKTALAEPVLHARNALSRVRIGTDELEKMMKELTDDYKQSSLTKEEKPDKVSDSVAGIPRKENPR